LFAALAGGALMLAAGTRAVRPAQNVHWARALGAAYG